MTDYQNAETLPGATPPEGWSPQPIPASARSTGLFAGLSTPIQPWMADLALMYGSYQLYQWGQRQEDAENGVPYLFLQPVDVQRAVRKEIKRRKMAWKAYEAAQFNALCREEQQVVTDARKLEKHARRAARPSLRQIAYDVLNHQTTRKYK